MALAEGPFDPEAPHKPDWSCSPRSLAVHPDGSQVCVLCGWVSFPACDCLRNVATAIGQCCSASRCTTCCFRAPRKGAACLIIKMLPTFCFVHGRPPEVSSRCRLMEQNA